MPELDSALVAKLADEISKRLGVAVNTNGNRQGASRVGVPRGAGGGGPNLRANDWRCKPCGYSNFSSRNTCRSCGTNRPSPGKGGGKQRSQQQASQEQNPTTRRPPGGKGLGGRPSGGVSAGKSYLAAARGPATIPEFTRSPGGKAASMHGGPKNSSTASSAKPRAGKANWFDLTAADSDTVVAEPLPEGTSQETAGTQSTPGSGSGSSTSASTGRDELQQQIQKKKKLVKYLEAQGFDADDRTLVYEKSEIDRIATLLDEDKQDSPPTGSKLDRAERQLRKAHQAQAALDEEIKALEAEYDHQLDLINQRYKEVEARIALHTASVKRIKAQLGGPAKVPRQLCEEISNAMELLGSLGPTLGAICEAAKSDPRIVGEGIDALEQLRKVGTVYSMLDKVDKGEWPVESSDSDDDDEEEDEEDDDEEEDDDPEMVEDGDVATTVAQQSSGAVDSQDSSTHPASPPAPPPHPAPPPAHPSPAAPTDGPELPAQQQPQHPPVPAATARDGPTAAACEQTHTPAAKKDSPAVQAARERKRSMAQAASRQDQGGDKAKPKLVRHQAVGGATAPTPVPEHATDMQVEE